MTSEPLPAELGHLTGIGKEKILGLRGLRLLGLIHSDDEPSKTPLWGRLVTFTETMTQLNWTARRVLGSEKAPDEKRFQW